jgi:threonine/homoserine/homoserine lactone efflux protein
VETIGDLLPAAVAVALSPIPIIAVVLMLGTPRARTNGPAFAVGWVAGMVAVSGLILWLAGGADEEGSGASDAVDWLKVAIGVLFLAMAVKQWQGRPRPGREVAMPKWMAAVDSFTPGRSLVLGAALSGVNPKNLALTAAAAATIVQNGLTGGDRVVAVAVFVAIASITVAGAVLFYLLAGERATAPLAAIKEFMGQHNAVIMMVILLILGAKILGDGLAGLDG